MTDEKKTYHGGTPLTKKELGAHDMYQVDHDCLYRLAVEWSEKNGQPIEEAYNCFVQTLFVMFNNEVKAEIYYKNSAYQRGEMGVFDNFKLRNDLPVFQSS